MSIRFSHTIYVGNLPDDIKEGEIEDLFYKYGRILDIELKIPSHPPCYCFVEFDSSEDAEDAIKGRDGYNFDGCRLRVELARGGMRRPPSCEHRRSCGGGGGSPFVVSRHSEFRVIICGLPSSASWQDLKDHTQKAGDVCFADHATAKVKKYDGSPSRSHSRSRNRSRSIGRDMRLKLRSRSASPGQLS